MSNATPTYLRRGPLLWLPAKWSEIRLVSALSAYPLARRLAKQLGFNPDDLSSEFSRQLARVLLDETAIPGWIADGMHHHDHDCPCSWKGALKVCGMIDDGTRTEDGALAAIRDFVAEVNDRQLAEQFKWAAGRVERGEFSRKDRNELDAVQDMAGVLL